MKIKNTYLDRGVLLVFGILLAQINDAHIGHHSVQRRGEDAV